MGIEALIFKAILFAASVAYQQKQAKKMKARMAAESEKHKGYAFTIKNESVPIPVIYGKQLAGGIQVNQKVSNNYITTTELADVVFSDNFNNVTVIGQKNEYLFSQYVICQDGISEVSYLRVNGQDYDYEDSKFNHRIRCHYEGGQADSVSTVNGFDAQAKFTGCAFAGATFKLNRDEGNYSGMPDMEFFVKGRKIRKITNTAGIYTLNSTYEYSNNSSYCLLDYLLNSDFGRGLAVGSVDLESFYNAAQVCDTIVFPSANVGGKINGGDGRKDIPLYECNILLDVSTPFRENIMRIMDTMGMAELTWTTNGKYKLLLEYPTSQVEMDALVPANLHFTEDTIIRNSFEFTFPTAQERLNQCTVTFRNEHEDFKEDSISWPEFNSVPYLDYLIEDNQIPYRTTTSGDGVTDPYHAKALAERNVRNSRSIYTASFTVGKAGLALEPGDFIKITLPEMDLSGETFRVESIKVNSDFTVGIKAYRFDYSSLAWNIADDIAYSNRPTYDFTIEPPTALTFVEDSSDISGFTSGKLSWVAASDINVSEYVVSISTDGGASYRTMGNTKSTGFDIGNILGGTYVFGVQSRSYLGVLSSIVSTATQLVTETPAVFTTVDVYKRDTSTPATPSGGVYDWSIPNMTTEPVGWSKTTPAGTDPVYVSKAFISTSTPTGTTAITGWSSPVIFVQNGEDGSDGIDGIDGYTPVKGIDYFDGIPGTDGADGDSAYVAWLAAGNSGTTTDFLNSLVGADGADGADGIPGPPGADGVTTYTWVKYADSEDGLTGFSNSPAGKPYIGFAFNKTTATESTNPADYTWSLIKGADGIDGYTPVKGIDYFDGIPGADGADGDSAYVAWLAAGNSGTTTDFLNSLVGADGADGADGIPGPPGLDGVTTYTWVKYADSGDGLTGFSNNPAGKPYIGFSFNKTTATESNTASDYTWSLIKGADGSDGADGYTPVKGVDYFDGLPGTNGADGDSAYDAWIAAGNSGTTTDFLNSLVGADGVDGSDGIPGAPGADGVTTYTWVKYADSGDGLTGFSNSPTGKPYIGFSFNKTTATESNTASDYTWSLIKGADGSDGANGVRGAGWWRYADSINASTYYATYTQARVGLAFTVATSLSPTEGDRLVIACTDIAIAYIYSSSSWIIQAEFIDGDLLVGGTITSDKLSSNQIDAMFATIGTLQSAASGARLVLQDDKIVVYDSSNQVRVKIGNLA